LHGSKVCSIFVLTTTDNITLKNLIIMKATKNIELNENNIVTAETADVFFAALLADEKEELKNDVEELYNLEKEAKESYKANNNTPNKEKETALYNGKVYFLNKYGSEKLCIFNMYSSLESKIDYVVYEKGTLKRHKNNKRNSQTKEY
jgi:hypothetical protein